jgi:hypothetical protein
MNSLQNRSITERNKAAEFEITADNLQKQLKAFWRVESYRENADEFFSKMSEEFCIFRNNKHKQIMLKN